MISDKDGSDSILIFIGAVVRPHVGAGDLPYNHAIAECRSITNCGIRNYDLTTSMVFDDIAVEWCAVNQLAQTVPPPCGDTQSPNALETSIDVSRQSR